MRKLLLLSFGLAFAASPALAQAPTSGQTIDALTAGSALIGSERIPMFQTANPAKTTTPGAIGTFLVGQGLFVPGSRTVGTSSPLTGGGALSGNLTIGLTTPNANLLGGTGTGFTSVSVGSGLSLSGGTLTATGTSLTIPNANILGGNGSTFTSIAVGSGLSLSGGTLTATGTSLTIPNATLLSGNGSALGSVTLGSNLSVTGSFPNFTLNAGGGAGSGTVGSGAAFNLAYYASAGTSVTSIGSTGTTTQVLHGNPSGTPTFGSVALADHATQPANTVIANISGSTTIPTTAFLPASCGDTGGNHLNYAQSTGFSCGTSSSGGGGGGLSGMTSGQVPIANSATTADHSVPTGVTGNTTIVQTDSGGRIDAGILPGGVTTAGGGITATAWKNGQAFVGSAALSLPAASSLSALTNTGIMIQAFGGNVTLTPQGGDGINGRTTGSPVTISNGTTTVCTTTGAAGVNAFTCPLGPARFYPLSWFSGTDYTAHSVPLVRPGLPVNVVGIICRPSAAVGGTANVDLYVVSNGQIAPGSGSRIANTQSCNASGTAGTEQSLTITAPSIPAGSWIEAVFTGSGWATNAGAGAIEVSVAPN
jgi:hypothetical protein